MKLKKKRENVPEKPSVNQMKKVPEAINKEFLSPSDPAADEEGTRGRDNVAILGLEKEKEEEWLSQSRQNKGAVEDNGAHLGLEGESEEEGLPQSPLNKGAVGGLREGRGSRVLSRVAILPTQNFSSSFNVSSYFKGGWIFDCGATDTMSFDPIDFFDS